jgi:para-aminobenzoate synthetase/4-amino-4-deoxychorismate lyase
MSEPRPSSKTPAPDPSSPSASTGRDRARAPYVLLDDNTGLGGPSALYTDAVEIVQADDPADVPAALARLQAAGPRGLHAAGFFAYELGYVLEPRLAPRMPKTRKVPLIWFGLFQPPRLLDSAGVEAWLVATTAGATARIADVGHSWDEAAYRHRFDRAIDNILSGDIYQLNLTFRARFRIEGSPLALYRELRQKQRVAYGGIIETGDVTVLSASPELFIERYGATITTRPMKGTSPRGADPARDAELVHTLATDAKQRAENLMIVDLMRNDLGRIAEVGSVEVTDLFTVETFRTLHQMTSGVRARLIDGVGLEPLLSAIFPPGSVTGAPKIRAMELIADLEDSPRGVYCGAIGRLSPDGHALFNVAIRTPVIFADGTAEMGIGSGVVADSDGGREYAECLLKMRFLTDRPAVGDIRATPAHAVPGTLPDGRTFQLIETLLHDPAQGDGAAAFWLLDRHLDRLERSAAHFGFAVDRQGAVAALTAAVAPKAHLRLRVRLLLWADGQITVTTTELPAAAPDAVMRYVISPTRLSSAEPFLLHKTTERQLYDREWQHFHDAVGADEVVYLNERDELCEGSRTTIFVERDGVLWTPPLAVGALPGVLRDELLATGRAREAVLTIADLSGGRVYLGNSVRALVRAELMQPERKASAPRQADKETMTTKA